MLGKMSTGQHIGSVIDSLLWVAIGIYWQFLLPKRVQKQLDAGKTSKEDAERLKRIGRYGGWLMIGAGLVLFVSRLFHWS
jgi:hypothetical protein